jgi:hypothetical protein
MKKYSSKQAKKGKTAYRTPSRFFSQQYLGMFKMQLKNKKKG